MDGISDRQTGGFLVHLAERCVIESVLTSSRDMIHPLYQRRNGRFPGKKARWVSTRDRFPHLQRGIISLQTDDFADEILWTDTNQFVHGGTTHSFGDDHRSGNLLHFPESHEVSTSIDFERRTGRRCQARDRYDPHVSTGRASEVDERIESEGRVSTFRSKEEIILTNPNPFSKDLLSTRSSMDRRTKRRSSIPSYVTIAFSNERKKKKGRKPEVGKIPNHFSFTSIHRFDTKHETFRFVRLTPIALLRSIRSSWRLDRSIPTSYSFLFLSFSLSYILHGRWMVLFVSSIQPIPSEISLFSPLHTQPIENGGRVDAG